MPQKTGTNQTDRKAIRKAVEMGDANPQRLAAELGCEVGPVRDFIKSLTKPKRGRKPNAEAEAPPSVEDPLEQT